MLRYYSLILIFIFLLSGCNIQVRYPSEFPSKTLITREENFWFWGLVGEKNYEINEICPKGKIYEIMINTTFLQTTFTVLTMGVYSPRTITFVCSFRGE